MTPLKASPTQKEIDDLFAKSTRARVIYPVSKAGGPRPSSLLVAEEKLPQFRAVLLLRGDDVPMGCHCPGTIAVELLKANQVIATLTAHLHPNAQSLWMAGSTTGAALCAGEPILDLLAQWGMPQPLQMVSESLREKTARGGLPDGATRRKKPTSGTSSGKK